MSWKGKFLPTAPKVEKRPRDDDDNDDDEDKDDKKKDKRSKNDAILSVLVQNDNTLRKMFQVKKDVESLALQSLYYYRYDSLLTFLASRPDFEMLVAFMYQENLNVLAVIERLAKAAAVIKLAQTDAERNKFTDVEKAYAELVSKSLYKVNLVDDFKQREKFHAAFGNLFLAQFEATPEIKAIIDIDEEEDEFGDVLLQDRIDQLFAILSETVRSRANQQPLVLADVARQRILSFLEGEDYNNYCKTTKELSEICESGRWKDAISDLRFERQFGDDADEVLQLRFRFYPPYLKTVNFRNAAIVVAKYFNKFAFVADPEARKETIQAEIMQEFHADVYLLSSANLKLPLVMYFLQKLHPKFAQEYFLDLFENGGGQNQGNLVDKEGKVYNGETLLKYLQRVKKTDLLVKIQDLETVRIVFEKNPNDDVWSEVLANLLTRNDNDGNPQVSVLGVIVPRWLNSFNGKRSRIKENIIRMYIKYVFTSYYGSQVQKYFDDAQTSSELWNRCILYAFEQYAKYPIEGWGRVAIEDTIFLILHLLKSGKLDANLEAPSLELIADAFIKDLKMRDHPFKVAEIPSSLFLINGSPKVWLPIARTIFAYKTDTTSENDENREFYGTDAEFPLAAGWLALQMLKDNSEENKNNLVELREIAESALPYAAKFAGDENKFLTELLPQIMQKNDDPHVWIRALRKLYDRSVDWIGRLEKKEKNVLLTTKTVQDMLDRFYGVTRKMQDFGFLSITNRELMARFVLKNIKYFSDVKDSTDWASRVLGYKD